MSVEEHENVVFSYSETVHDTLNAVLEREISNIETASTWIAEAIDKDGLLYVAGTGHSHMLAEEVFYRAGGLMSVSPILEPALMLHQGAQKSTKLERLEGLAEIILEDSGISARDVLIITSNSGRNSLPVEMAFAAMDIGCKVIAVTSRDHSQEVASRHSSGKRLFEVADLVIDNCVRYGDATTAVPGMKHKMGPVSTISGTFIMNSLVARAAQILAAAGTPPKVFIGANVSEHADDYRQERAEELERLRRRVKVL